MNRLLSLIAAALLLAALPTAASASRTQESMFQDDIQLVYGQPAVVEKTLDQLKAFGVDRIRVSVFWKIVAPANDSVTKPNFDPTDPAAYPAAHWERYDRLIRSARDKGILVNLNITSPVPRWAAGTAPASRADLQDTWAPSTSEFGQFVKAVGTRYSGKYQGLPRVNYWSVWNEPNQAGWLTPQWSPDPRKSTRLVEAAPAIYRGLVAAAWTGLADSGHGTDTILIGETAPQGSRKKKGVSRSLDALRFIRRLYCVDDNLQLLKGRSADIRSCPRNDPGGFVAQNPALFRASGYAHHPYDLLAPPSVKPTKSDDWVTVANLRDLSRELKRIYQRYRQKPQTRRGTPLYLTEYGYQTKPDPVSVSFSQQAAFNNEAEYLTMRNPNVRALSQFLLVDDAPTANVDPKTNPSLAWRTFQSGLMSLAGKKKPSYKAYITPLHVKTQRVRRGTPVRIFGMLRAADAQDRERVSIQWRPKGSKRYKTRKRLTVKGPRHYLNTSVRVPRSGYLRLRWRNGSKITVSRPARVTVLRKRSKR